jgi:putative ABC transport system permease protein
MRDDLRDALRRIRRNPRTSLLAAGTLALGMGAGTAVFTMAHTLLIAPPPFRDPGRIVEIQGLHTRSSYEGVSPADLADYRRESNLLAASTLSAYGEFSWTGQSLPGFDGAEVLRGRLVSSDYFRVFDQPMAAGRGFALDENDVIVLSYNLWQRRFGGQPTAVGATLTFNDRPYTVVGITGPNFQAYEGYEVAVWVPVRLSNGARDSRGQSCYARLAPGITLAQAQQRFDAINLRLQQAYPDTNKAYNARVMPLLKNFQDENRPAMMVLTGAVLCLLLIAAANVASLLLARATAQAREMTIRVALGASRMRIARLILAESTVLALIAMSGGLLLAVWMIHALRAWMPTSLSLEWMLAIDWRVFAISFALSTITGVVAGMAPAFESFRLAAGGMRGGVSRNHSLRVIASAEVALAIVLSIGAGLLGKSFLQLTSRPLGYRTDHLLGMRIRLRGERYNTTDLRAAYWNELVARAGAIPGVAKATTVSDLPMGHQYSGGGFYVADKPVRPGEKRPRAHQIVAASGYFATLGIPLLSGRAFTEADGPQSEPVAIVNDLLARSVWPGENPIGKQVRSWSKNWARVVGVVQGVRHGGPEDDVENQLYFPYRQANQSTMFLVLRSHVAPESLASATRDLLKSIDPNVPAFEIRSLEKAFERDIAGPRLAALLTTGFAGLAALLAALGLFGVIAYWVSSRTRELGIRSALGAEQTTLRMLVLAQGLRMTGAGVIVGVGVSFGVMRYLQSLLYGMSERDPWIYAAAVLLAAVAATLACWIPAARAARADPAVALREE